MYIMIENKDQDIEVMYSFPATLNEGVHLRAQIELGLDYVSPAYAECKRLEEIVINYAGYCISQHTTRCATVAKPIHMDEKFTGAIIWESKDLPKIFDELIRPVSFISGKYPFLQIRTVENPLDSD